MRAFPVLPPSRSGASGGSAWSPSSLTGLVQRALDANPTYHASTLQSLPILTPEETGTVAVPRGQRCALFDGSNDNATLGANLSIAGSGTFAAWILPTNDYTTYRCILANRYNSGTNYHVGIEQSSGKLLFYSQGTLTPFNYVPSTSVWTHVVMVANPSTTDLYINGAFHSSVGYGIGATHASNRFFIGANTGGEYWFGKLREVLVDDEAYSPSDIATLYSTHLPPVGKTPLGFWPLQEESGTTAYDVSGNGKHLTLTNITQATFHATDSGVTYNVNNWKGHTLGRNMLARSQEFSTASPWNSDGGALTFTPNSTTAPDGTTTAETAAFNNGGTDFMYQLVTGPGSGVTCTFSIYLRSVSGTVNIGLRESSTNTWTVVTATTTWQRFTLTFTAGSFVNIGIDQRAVAVTGATAVGSVYLWGAQVETGSTASDYQATAATGFAPGVVIPASLSTPTQDAAGNALGVAGPVAHPVTAEVQAWTGDGSAAYVDCGASPIANGNTAYSHECWVRFTNAPGSLEMIAGHGAVSGNQAAILYRDGAGKLTSEHWGSGGMAQSTTILAANTWYKVKSVYDGSTNKVYVNDVLEATTTWSSFNKQGTFFYIGRFSTFYLNGQIAGYSVTTGGVTYYPLFDQCGPGSSNTNRDFYIMGSDGSAALVSGGIVNGTISSIFANLCPYVRDWSVQYGGGIAANGSFIPGRIGSGNDAAGNAKTLTAGKHGNPYSRLVPNYWSAPELVNIGYTSSSKLAPSTTVQATSPADTKFARIKAAGSDRYFAVQAALTGSEKTNAESYVA